MIFILSQERTRHIFIKIKNVHLHFVAGDPTHMIRRSHSDVDHVDVIVTHDDPV